MTGNFEKQSISIKPEGGHGNAATGESAPRKKRGHAATLRPAWKPGESGNPAGRSKGSRNKLKEAFLNDLCEAWEKHGVAAVEKVAKDDPAAFLRVVASLLPKGVTGEDGGPLKFIMLPGDEDL